jgi:hypothetical protein
MRMHLEGVKNAYAPPWSAVPWHRFGQRADKSAHSKISSGAARYDRRPDHDPGRGGGVGDSDRPSPESGDDAGKRCPSSSRRVSVRGHPSVHRVRHGS